MPYKFNTKTFTLKEKHPISKQRFENAIIYIMNELNTHPMSFKLCGLELV
jgi:hypothetical protein